ncbi:MAG TPA: protein kinase [Vicinamibacterales bacterium]|nr:protein kinase [Vicinamibacterales bacterium]
MAAEGHLVELAEAVADGRVIDWDSEELSARTPEERAVVHHLRLLAGVAGVHRSTVTSPLDPDDLVDAAQEITSGTWGPLEIKECIGGGSFGMVYRAWDPRLARDVALKLLRRQTDDAQASVIIEEGRMLARIRHPHVITVYGASRYTDRVGIWMEYIRGRTLERVIAEDGTMGAREAALIGSELCSALAAVHGQGVVHRDIKAHNVMREEGGRLVLMDFGAGEDPFAPAKSGTIAGTPLYMAPELFTGSKATPASDLYSLGVLLFRLVTGKYPVNGKTVDQVRAAHERNERLHLRDVRPDLPPGFVKAVERALAPNPAERFDSAGAFEAALGTEVLSDSARSGEVVVVPPKRRWKNLSIAVTLSAVVVAAAFLVPRVWRTPEGPRVIAVRPFQNQTGDDAQRFFTAGLTDVLLAQLGAIRALRVVALGEAPAGKTPSLDETAARYPGAFAVLEGSVARAQGQVRVSARLVQLASGAILWSNNYTESDGDAFGLQGRIALELANELHVAMTTADTRRVLAKGPATPAAQEAYLRGRYQLGLSGRDNLLQAREAFDRVLAAEPQFAPALAGRARTFMGMGNVGLLTPDEVNRLAVADARAAFAIDPQLAEAALAIADVRFRLEWKWPEADLAYRTAIELNPSFIDAHTWYARYLAAAGRPAEGLAQVRSAALMDPASDDVYNVIGLMLFYSRHYPEAIEHYKQRLSDSSTRGRVGLARSYAAAGRFDDAIAMIRTAIAMSDDPSFHAELTRIVAASGRTAEARQLLAGLEARRAANADYMAPQDFAYVQIALGDVDRGLALLQQGVNEHASRLLWLGVDPRVDAVRGDPRFITIIRRLGIPTAR